MLIISKSLLNTDQSRVCLQHASPKVDIKSFKKAKKKFKL
jgi:hypothetical protein